MTYVFCGADTRSKFLKLIQQFFDYVQKVREHRSERNEIASSQLTDIDGPGQCGHVSDDDFFGFKLKYPQIFKTDFYAQ